MGTSIKNVANMLNRMRLEVEKCRKWITLKREPTSRMLLKSD